MKLTRIQFLQVLISAPQNLNTLLTFLTRKKEEYHQGPDPPATAKLWRTLRGQISLLNPLRTFKEERRKKFPFQILCLIFVPVVLASSVSMWVLCVRPVNFLHFEVLLFRLNFRKSKVVVYLIQANFWSNSCVASVCLWFRSKKRPWKGIFGFDRAVFDPCSSFFPPKPHRNACYGGYPSKGGFEFLLKVQFFR